MCVMFTEWYSYLGKQSNSPVAELVLLHVMFTVRCIFIGGSQIPHGRAGVVACDVYREVHSYREK